ncbi:MAG: HEAT repeat domain-containing protein [Planctomycetes bacterium]|nr:HEAT repeat domain-containing protein [Planctomycetota bacterium]
MPSPWPPSTSTSDHRAPRVVAILLLAALLGACGEDRGRTVGTDPRVPTILDEAGELEARLDLIDSLRAPCPQDVVEALLRVMKDRSQQAYVTIADDGDLGYHVEESPYGGPDERAEIRWTAVIALDRLGEVQALPDLLAALNDRHPVVANHAALALWNLGSAEGLPVLVKNLEAKAFANETANEILCRIAGQDLGFDTDAGWKRKEEAIARWQAWLATGPKPPRALPQKGQDADLDRRVRFLVAILGQHQFLFMEQARRELSRLDGLALEHIRVAFDDPALGRDNQQLRAYAIQALALMHDPRAQELIVERLGKDPAAPVRSRAAEAIGQADSGGREALLHALDDHDPSVQLAVVRALGRRGLEDVTGRIRDLLASPAASERLKLTAAFALVRNGLKGDGAGALLYHILAEGQDYQKAELAELLQEWQGDLKGWDERRPAAEQAEALAVWRKLLVAD